MREAEKTTRRRIAERLRSEPATPSELAAMLDGTPQSMCKHVEHVARSIDAAKSDEQLLVSPPTCRDCGFDSFDDPVNRPSRCPNCKSESITEPIFVIE